MYGNHYGNAGGSGTVQRAGQVGAGVVDGGGQPGGDILAALTSAVPALSSLVTTVNDPYRQVATLEAKLLDAKRRGKSSSKIAQLQARLDAARARLALSQEDRQQLRTFSTLTQVGIITGIALGVSGILFVLTQTFGAPKKAARKRK